MTVINYLQSGSGNSAKTARVFGIQHCVVSGILQKYKAGNLSDLPKVTKSQPARAPLEIEEKVIVYKNKTRLGPMRLSLNLARYGGIQAAPGTKRHIVRCNRDQLTYPLPTRKDRKKKCGFVGWYNAKPFEVVQIDLKQIRNQKALTKSHLGYRLTRMSQPRPACNTPLNPL